MFFISSWRSSHPSPGGQHLSAPPAMIAEFGGDAPSFARNNEGCCVARALHGRAAAEVRLALGRAGVPRGMIKKETLL